MDDEYLNAHSNPYYISGNAGGTVGALDLSLHALFTGLPAFSTGSGLQFGGTNTLVLSGTNVAAVGGDLSLVYTGTSGLISSSSAMFSASNEGGGSPSSSELANNMIDDGRPRPPNSDAHHIVAGSDPRVAQARAILRREGIGINDADNGAWLPRQFHWRVHTDEYYALVNARLVQARPGTVRNLLKSLGDSIETGQFP